MWSVVVVVVDDEFFELLLVPDDGVVEESAPQGPDPAFSERVRDWCADRGLDDVEAFGSEDLVEGVDALAALVLDESRRASDVRKPDKMRFTRSGSVGFCPVQQLRPSFGHPHRQSINATAPFRVRPVAGAVSACWAVLL